MKRIHFFYLLIAALLLSLTSIASAESLEIKVNKSLITLPYYPTHKRIPNGAVILVQSEKKGSTIQFLNGVIKQLSDYGWSVAVLDITSDAEITWTRQLPELISMLRQQDNKRIVLLHYGDRLKDTLGYFLKPQAKQVNGLVLLSAYDERMTDQYKVKLRFPVYDVAGQFDYEHVLQQMSLRSEDCIKSNYRAMRMPGANHDYEYNNQLLLSYIHGWMNRLPETHPVEPILLYSYIPSIPRQEVMELVVSK